MTKLMNKMLDKFFAPTIIIPCELTKLKPHMSVRINNETAVITEYNSAADLWKCEFVIGKDGYKTGTDGWYDLNKAKVGYLKEIKFRAKPIDTALAEDGTWVYGTVQQETASNNYCIIQTNGERIPVDPATIGQYIRMHDNRWNEIYEGDIVSIESTLPYDGSTIHQTITIDDITNYESLGALGTAERIKIIGNIYAEKEADLSIDQEDDLERE